MFFSPFHALLHTVGRTYSKMLIEVDESRHFYLTPDHNGKSFTNLSLGMILSQFAQIFYNEC